LHPWGDEERTLLWAAAILHNCGHHVGHSSHHKHSYYLIRHAELLGFTEMEIETIANLARYHRKNPPKKRHETYRNLTSKRHRKIVDQLHSLLRLAVALDRRQIGAIQSIECHLDAMQRDFQMLIKPSQSGDPCSLELWSLDFKKGDFEAEYGVKLIPVLQKN
jgi:exopolyphosphatase / guanosine-5'-triphosphate,3'-diphosphate pyrophosphatase